VGTHTYNVNLYNTTSTLVASTTYTVTVGAANTDATTLSQLFLNDSLPTTSTYRMADSALVVSAGQTPTLSLMTPAKVGYLGVNFRNSAVSP